MKPFSHLLSDISGLDVSDGGQSPISINQMWSCAVPLLQGHLWDQSVISARRAWHALTTSDHVGGGEVVGEGLGIRPGWCPAAIYSSLAHEGGFNRGWWGGIKWKRGLESLSGSRWRSRG